MSSCKKNILSEHILNPDNIIEMDKRIAGNSYVKRQSFSTSAPKFEERNALRKMRPTSASLAKRLEDDCNIVYNMAGVDKKTLHGRILERQDIEDINIRMKNLPQIDPKTYLGRKVIKYSKNHEEQQKRHYRSLKEPVLRNRDYLRMQKAAQITTIDHKFEELERKKEKEEKEDNEYEDIRKYFKDIDYNRRIALKSFIQTEDLWGAEEKLKILDRVFIAQYDNEDEIKFVNQLIMNAKCTAVREAQINEKKQIQDRLRNEDMNLSKMVNTNALKQIEEENYKNNKIKEKRLAYGKEIREQLHEREVLRILEAERIAYESENTRAIAEMLKEEELQEKQLAKERAHKFQEELRKVQEMSALFKRLLCEEERESEMRVAAYIKQKQEREKQIAKEKQIIKEIFLANQNRLVVLQQKVFEAKSRSQDIAFMRERERIEREYRRKEKEATLRKKELEDDLVKTRQKQIEEGKKALMLKAINDQHEFAKLIEDIKKDEEKQKLEEIKNAKKLKLYRKDIIKQMKQKYDANCRLNELELKDLIERRQNDLIREENVQFIIKNKLQAMRDACLPEKYIQEVELQLQKIQNKK